jgi:hypothetical protein
MARKGSQGGHGSGLAITWPNEADKVRPVIEEFLGNLVPASWHMYFLLDGQPISGEKQSGTLRPPGVSY